MEKLIETRDQYNAIIGLKKKQIVKAETEDGNWVECYRRATEALLNWEMSRKQEAKAS